MAPMRGCIRYFSRLIVLSSLLAGSMALAHSPHDDIFDVAVAVREDGSARMFVTVRGNLLYSDDDGETWRRALNGLNHRYQLFSIGVAASNPNMVYVGSLGEGIFRSRDGGDSWSALEDAQPVAYVQRLVVSPVDGDTVVALGSDGNLFLSSDGGDTWTAVLVAPGQVVDQVGIDRQGAHLLAALSDRQLVSLSLLDPEAEPVLVLEDLGARGMSIAPAAGESPGWLVGLQNGLLLGISGEGSEPERLWRAPNNEPVRAVIGAGDQAWDLLAVADMDGPWCRARATGGWSQCNRGLSTDAQALELGRPFFSNLAAFDRPEQGKEILLAGYDGLFRSLKPDSRWTPVETLSLSLVVGLAASPTTGEQDAVYLTTYLWGAYQSTDGGATWQSINSGANDYRRPAGYTRLFNIYPVNVPGKPPELFTSSWYRWLQRTSGSGRWTQAKFIDEEAWLNIHHGVTAAFSPDFAQDGTLILASHRGAVLRSVDHGATFQEISSLPEEINQVVMAMAAKGERIVFAMGVGTLFMSRNGGDSWRPVLDVGTLEPPRPALSGRASILHEIGGRAWLEHIESNDARTAAGWVEVSPAFSQDRTVFAGGLDGLFRSTDGGETFAQLEMGELSGPVDGLAISPGFEQDRTLLVAIRGKGLLRSQDAGENFLVTGSRDDEGRLQLANYHSYPPPISPPIRFSPDFSRNRTIYGFEGTEVWRSRDGGETWEKAWSANPDAQTLWLLRRVHLEAGIASHWRQLKTSRKRQAVLGFAFLLFVGGAWAWRTRRERTLQPQTAVADAGTTRSQ